MIGGVHSWCLDTTNANAAKSADFTRLLSSHGIVLFSYFQACITFFNFQIGGPGTPMTPLWLRQKVFYRDLMAYVVVE